MSGELAAEALMSKAVRASASARALLDLGDVDGACNRAYYAMFDAARAALPAAGAPVQPDLGKTHAGLIAAFGLQLVKNGPITKELGRLLKRAEEIRLVADYKGDSLNLKTPAKWWGRRRSSSTQCAQNSCRQNRRRQRDNAMTLNLPELIHEMVTADYAEARRDALVKSPGFQTFNHHE